MIYEFQCDACGAYEWEERPMSEGPSPNRPCSCGHGSMDRIWNSPQIHVSQSYDPDDIPVPHRVSPNTAFGDAKGERTKRFKAYQQDIEAKRKATRDGGNRGRWRMTHSIPTEMFHEQIKKTGDRNYWDDPKNRDKHRNTRIS